MPKCHKYSCYKKKKNVNIQFNMKAWYYFILWSEVRIKCLIDCLYLGDSLDRKCTTYKPDQTADTVGTSDHIFMTDGQFYFLKLFSWRQPMKLTVITVHDDTDTSIQEGVKDSN